MSFFGLFRRPNIGELKAKGDVPKLINALGYKWNASVRQDAAEAMRVSQPTFSRILETGHRKITLALLNGKPIRIHGGNVDFKKSFVGYGCLNCNYEWEDEKGSLGGDVSRGIHGSTSRETFLLPGIRPCRTPWCIQCHRTGLAESQISC